MKSILLLVIILLASCASKSPEVQGPPLEIVEIKPNKWTGIMKQNLLQLTQVYDLEPFFYTRKVHIESRVIPRSHPVLTLNTRNAENPNKILSTFLHEEFHWWVSKNSTKARLAIKDLKRIFPKAPVTKSMGPDSTYLHLIINYLELRALKHYLGKKEAGSIIRSIMQKDRIYPWIYNQVLRKEKIIKKIVEKHDLLPPPLN